MKPGEYIQILKFIYDISPNNIIAKYTICEGVEWFETARRFDELRELHRKLKKELDLHLIYAHHDLTKANMLQDDIARITTEFKIQVMFLRKETIEYRKGVQAIYKYQNHNITDLIVFAKNYSKSHVSSMQL